MPRDDDAYKTVIKTAVDKVTPIAQMIWARMVIARSGNKWMNNEWYTWWLKCVSKPWPYQLVWRDRAFSVRSISSLKIYKATYRIIKETVFDLPSAAAAPEHRLVAELTHTADYFHATYCIPNDETHIHMPGCMSRLMRELAPMRLWSAHIFVSSSSDSEQNENEKARLKVN